MPWNSHLAVQNFFEFADVPSDGEPSRNSQSPLWSMRDRLFLSLFERISSAYSSAVPAECRKSVENVFLAFAVVPLFVLIYIHINFIQTPVNSLAHVSADWPRDGILRVELNFKHPKLNSYGTCNRPQLTADKLCQTADVSTLSSAGEIRNSKNNETDSIEELISSSAKSLFFLNRETDSGFKNKSLNSARVLDESVLNSPSADLELLSQTAWPQQLYVIEYTLEYGFLKLSTATRKKLKIPVLVVILDPNDEKCFGNAFSRFLLRYVVGYSDVLMSSLKNLVDKDENKGFVKNVVSGDQYRFINKTLTWTSYVVAGLTMVAFTISISMLLRYSHHQIFVFIVQLLHVLEFNLNTSFPAASLLTVVFALVGMEAIMSEFFNDSTTAFYIILIVWIADQFDTICCHHAVTKRHWLRFFYLYHFAFYAYDYRFNGQYSALALFISWMFIQHSMIYFFHRFELRSQLQNSGELSDVNNEMQPVHNLNLLLHPPSVTDEVHSESNTQNLAGSHEENADSSTLSQNSRCTG